MSTEIIKTLENKIRDNAKLEQPQKAELLELMNNLKEELGQLQQTDRAKARKIAGLTDASAQKAFDAAIRAGQENPLLELENSVGEFEVSHPRLVRIINRICIMFSSIGI